MNKLQRYEELITEKLEQRPIPDMADAIWANIEKGLDADPPPGNEPSQPPSAPSPVARRIKGTGLIIIAAVIVAFLIFRKKHHTGMPVQPAGTVPAKTTAVDSSFEAIPISPVNTNRNVQPDKKTRDAMTVDTGSDHNPALNPTVTTDVINDSQSVTPPPVISDSGRLSQSQQLTQPEKKSKGVKLSDSDYKIIPVKKD